MGLKKNHTLVLLNKYQCFDTPKVKVTVEDQMFILVRSTTSTFMKGFQKHFAQLFSLYYCHTKSVFVTPKVNVTVAGQMTKSILSGAPLLHLIMDFKITSQFTHLFS